MKLKSFIKWQVKQWLPLFILAILFMGSFVLLWTTFGNVINWVSDLSRPPVANDNYNEIMVFFGETSNCLSIMIPLLFVITLIMPIFVYSYRFNRRQTDTFMQAPFSKNNFRITRILIGLALILISFSIVYFLGVLIIGVRQLSLPDVREVNDGVLYLKRFNFGHYFTAYLFFILIASLQYFINCMIVSFADSILDAILLLFFVHCILIFAEFVLASTIITLGARYYLNGPYVDSYEILNLILFSPSMLYFFFLGSNIFEPLITGEYVMMSIVHCQDYIYILNGIIFALLSGVSIYKIFFVRDPSGEFAGKGGPRKYPISLLIHGYFLMIGLLYSFVGITGILVLIILFFVCYSISYYAVIAIYNRTFKINKVQIITMSSIAGVSLLFTIIYSCLGIW